MLHMLTIATQEKGATKIKHGMPCLTHTYHFDFKCGKSKTTSVYFVIVWYKGNILALSGMHRLTRFHRGRSDFSEAPCLCTVFVRS